MPNGNEGNVDVTLESDGTDIPEAQAVYLLP